MSANAPPGFEPIDGAEDFPEPGPPHSTPPPGFAPLRATSGPPPGFQAIKGLGPATKPLYAGMQPGEAPVTYAGRGTGPVNVPDVAPLPPGYEGADPALQAAEAPAPAPPPPPPGADLASRMAALRAGGQIPAGPAQNLAGLPDLTPPREGGEMLDRPFGFVPTGTMARTAGDIAGNMGLPEPMATVAGNVVGGAAEAMTSPKGLGLGAAAAANPIAAAAIGSGIALKSAYDMASRDFPAFVEGVIAREGPKIIEGLSSTILDALGVAGGAAGARAGYRGAQRGVVEHQLAAEADRFRYQQESIPGRVVQPGEGAAPAPPPEAPAPPAPMDLGNRGNLLPPAGFEPISPQEAVGGPTAPPEPQPAPPPAPEPAPAISDALRTHVEALEQGFKEDIQAGNNEAAMAKRAELDQLESVHGPLTAPPPGFAAYRLRSVGEEGIPATGAHAQATGSLEEAMRYADDRQAEKGKPQEIMGLRELPDGTKILEGPNGNPWFQFAGEGVPEHELQTVRTAIELGHVTPAEIAAAHAYTGDGTEFELDLSGLEHPLPERAPDQVSGVPRAEENVSGGAREGTPPPGEPSGEALAHAGTEEPGGLGPDWRDVAKTRRERIEARLARRREWQTSREKQAAGAFARVEGITDNIPLGQPILVGHHSEAHARSDQKKIEAGMRAGVESQAMAKLHGQKADGIERQLETSIYSDDPDAPERLTEKIASLEAERVRMRKVNAEIKKGPGWEKRLADSGEPLTKRETEQLTSVAKYQPEHGGKFPAYAFQNIGGNIARLKGRLAEIQGQRGTAAPSPVEAPPEKAAAPPWVPGPEAVPESFRKKMEARQTPPVSSEVGAAPAPPKAEERPTLPSFTPILGKASRVKTERGLAVDTKFALTSAESLVASHDTGLSPNPAYPPEFQPRDRERAASELQVDRILKNLEPEWLGENPKASDGAPIVGPDGIVESGNARAIALRRGYEQRAPNIVEYRSWLLNHAEAFGLSRQHVDRVKHPVLVRVRQGETDRAEFARQANEQSTARMSPTEQAGADAARLTANLMDLFDPSEDGDLMAASNRPFLGAFLKDIIGPTELGNYLDENGTANKQLLDRVRAAVLQKTYGNSDVVGMLSESLDSNIKNIGNGLVMGAPALASMKAGIAAGALHPLDITSNIAEAAQLLSSLKREGKGVENYLKQDDLFGEAINPATAEMLRYFDQNKRSSKKIALFLKEYARAVDAAGDPREGDLFGMGRAPNIGEVILVAQKSTAEASGEDKSTGDLFGSESGNGPGTQKKDGGTGSGGLQSDSPLASSGYRGGRSSGRFASAAASLEMGGPPIADRSRPRPRVRVGVIDRPAPRNEFLQKLLDAGKDVQTALAPATVDDRALASGDVVRYRGAELSVKQQATEHTLRVVRGRLDRLSFPTAREIAKIAKLPEGERIAALEKFDGVRFMDSVETYKKTEMRAERPSSAMDEPEEIFKEAADAMGHEEGRPYDTPELEAIGNMLHGVLDLGRREVQALGTGKLSRFIENYFPHLWSNVTRAEEFAYTYIKQRSMEGNKSWMKQRKYPTVIEGLAAGLIPTHRNPVDAVLAHSMQLRKYVMAHRALDDLKALGTVRPFDADTKLPLAWERIDGRLGDIWGDREIPIEESIDGLMWQKLQDFAKKNGIRIGREVGVGGPLGLANMQSGDVLTKFGSQMATLVHEIGHSLDGKFKVWDQLFPPKTEAQRIAEAIVKQWDRTAPRTKAEREGRARARQELAKMAADREALRRELRSLADLRFEGEEDVPKKVSDRSGFTAYVRDRKEQIANLFDAYVNHRERLADVAPVAFARLEQILDKHGLSDLKDIRPSLVREARFDTVPLEGKHLLGYLAAPKGVARILNRYLSPGLQQKAVYQGVRFLFNSLNQFQLGLSAYHAVFTALDSMVSRGALGLYQVMNGTQTADGLLKMLTGPAAPFIQLVHGQKMLEASGLARQIFGSAMTGQLAEDVKATIEAGGRFRQDANYVAAAKARWISALRAALGELEHGRPGAATKQAYSAAWRTPFAAIELAAGPIMEWWVPRLKLGTFAEMARAEVERLGENATRSEIRRALARAWDSVDNRMGQLAYDNLFWNRTVKDLLLIAVRSLGWNLGTFREMGGGVYDFATIPMRLGGGGGGKLPPQPPAGAGPPEEGEPDNLRPVDLRAPWFTHRMGYLLYGAFLMGLIGSTIHYLRTGRRPKDAKDIYFPETGGKNRDGTPERLTLPSYVKEPVAWYKRPWETFTGKLNPGLHALENLWKNREFPNTRIYDTNDPVFKKGMDVLKYLGRQSVPIGMRGFTDRPNPDSAIPRPWARMAGAIAAPGYISKTPLQEAISEWHAQNPTAPISREKADQKQGWRETVDKYRKAQTPEEKSAATEGQDLTNAQRGQLRRQGAMTPLQRSFSGINSLHEQLRMYDLGTPEEKQELRGVLLNKFQPHVNVDTRGRVHVVRPGWGSSMTAPEKERLRGELEKRLNEEAP